MTDEPAEPDLKPVAESRAAFEWLSYYGDHAVEQSMARMGHGVREIVPACFAMSLTMADSGLTFTLMCEREGAAPLDAMQFLEGEPCAPAEDDTVPGSSTDLPTDETRWQLHARAEAFAGIRSTLSLPFLDGEGEGALGDVNLYATTSHAFDGHHDEIADACGAWAGGAVTNADLRFITRVRAAAAPERLRERGTMDVACGYVAAHQDIPLDEAAVQIRTSAHRAGVSEFDLARLILDGHGEPMV
jgi:hypothetical protein